MRAPKHRWAPRVPIGCLIVAITSACSNTAVDDAKDLANTEAAGAEQQMLRGGTVTQAFGVVDFVEAAGQSVTNGSYNCTGSMIAPNAIVTAAHCFDPLGAQSTTTSGSFPATIRYFDPVHGTRIVFDSKASGNATWIKLPTYSGSSSMTSRRQDDVAVIIIPGTFAGTDYHDYKRLFAGGTGSISTRLNFYGAGIYDPLVSSDDANLRVGSLAVESVDSWVVSTDNGTAIAPCHGDSGGPLIKLASTTGHPDSLELIVGDLSQTNIDNQDDPCGYVSSGIDFTPDNSYFARVDVREDWIASTIGHACTLQTGASEAYRRCFDLPFIEDVDFEGLSLGQEVAMTNAITVL